MYVLPYLRFTMFPDHGIQLEYKDKEDSHRTLPEKLFVALECLLDDPVEKVKTAAAITLYSLNRPCKGVGLIIVLNLWSLFKNIKINLFVTIFDYA